MPATLLCRAWNRLRDLPLILRRRQAVPGFADPKPGPDLLYRDYRLFVVSSGAGWRVFIHRPGSPFAYGETPGTDDPLGREQVVAQAKDIVDRLVAHSADDGGGSRPPRSN